MKKIYLMVLAVFIVSLFLFLVSFVYLDRHNHRTFYYSIFTDGQYTGGVKIDKFMTEEKLVFKSVAMTPFRELVTEKRTRLDLDRRILFKDERPSSYVNLAKRAESRHRSGQKRYGIVSIFGIEERRGAVREGIFLIILEVISPVEIEPGPFFGNELPEGRHRDRFEYELLFRHEFIYLHSSRVLAVSEDTVIKSAVIMPIEIDKRDQE